MKIFSSLVVVMVLAACAAAPPSFDAEAEAAELMRISREWSDVAGSGDLEATLAYWADDAVMMPPGMPPLKGKQAIREFVEGSANIPGFAISWEPLEAHVSPSGDFAYLLERNQFSFQDSTGQQVTEWNKVVTVWRKEVDGSWKNVIDMWNTDPTAWR
jgi:ketosteroid isomerase-like protein